MVTPKFVAPSYSHIKDMSVLRLYSRTNMPYVQMYAGSMDEIGEVLFGGPT